MTSGISRLGIFDPGAPAEKYDAVGHEADPGPGIGAPTAEQQSSQEPGLTAPITGSTTTSQRSTSAAYNAPFSGPELPHAAVM